MARGTKFGTEQDNSTASVPETGVRYFSVRDLAEELKLSVPTVTAIFEKEPGVIIITPQNGGKISRRNYRTLRIPEPVKQRVLERMSVKAKAS